MGNHTQNFPKVVSGQDAQDMHGLQPEPQRLIEMRNIVKSFNIGDQGELTIIHGCVFVVDRGELMNIIGLLDRPTEGTYFFDGVDMLDSNDDQLARYRSKNIGFVFQNFNLIARINAIKNVEIPMIYAGYSAKERYERATELLELVGMKDRMKHQPNELSGGQKQRVAIARALANNPEVLLADEPTGALDSSTGRLVMDLFHQLNQEQGKTIVFITHNAELAEETTRIVTMVDGVFA